MSESQKNSLSVDPDRALFEGQIQGLVMTLFQNERPPSGLCGNIDWYFQGAISQCLKKGAITGAVGECTYFPLAHQGSTLHLILVGAGHSSSPGEREQVPHESIQVLHQNLLSLKLPKLGISKFDFGQVAQEYFYKHLKGVPLWITP